MTDASSVRAALAVGVERFVYTSTDDVLVQAPGLTPYQRSKQEADRIVTAALDRGLPAVFLHPAGLYGPSPFLVKGLNDLLLQLAKRKAPMLLPGGMGVAYSDDVADGHIRAANQAPVGARYVLAESFQSLTDIARTVAATEPRAKVLERGSQPSGMRARTELGWDPTPFAAGVERTLAHFRRQGWM